MLYTYNNYSLEKFKYNLNKDIYDKIYTFSKKNINKLFAKFNEKNDLIMITSLSIYLLYFGLNIENINNINPFLEQLNINNNENFYAIVNLILPYLDDQNESFNQKNIKSFQDLVENESKGKKTYSNYFYDHNNISNMFYSYNDKKYNTLQIETEIDLNYELVNRYYDNISLLLFEIINSVRYKLYINWINIFPLTIDNYKKSKLYKNSTKLNFPLFNVIDVSLLNKDIIDNIPNFNNLIKESNEMAFTYFGLNVEDIYNCLVNDYYLSTKRIKWLIFNNPVGSKIYLNIKILDDLLNLENIFNEKQFNLLNKLEKVKFEKNWDNYKNLVKKSNKFKIYSSEIIIKLFRSLVIYFEFNYVNISELEKEKKYKLIIKENITDLDDIYDKYVEFDSIKLEKFINAIDKVPSKDIYNFLYNEIMYLKNTIYNDSIFYQNKIQFNKINLNSKNIEIPPKYFYNYAKNLYQPYSDKLEFKNLWSGLSLEQKYVIVHKLNSNEDEQNWFKITKILSEFDKYDDVINVQKRIYKEIKDNLIDVIFESLIKKGCINKFELHPELVDDKILSNDYLKRIKKRGDNMLKVLNSSKIKEYQEGYYFVNNKKYKDIIVNNKEKINNVNFVEYISKIGETGDYWNTFYSVNWVSQIDFYFRFINQRVMLVTGATGQGKSTQVPKLYLYGLKSFLYKNNGKIICTVPRKDPTLENTKNISSSMGIGIEEYSKHYKQNVTTLNHVIQYKYEGSSHIKKDSNYFLRIVTDGTLLLNLNNNMLLKNKTNNKILNTNIFDVVMIDEAHEHGVNMDLILTIMRHTLFYNNDLKLSIISATMEEDEPIFRRYYRFLDDNLTYPINLYNLGCGIDKNFIDRRYHISPPGATTQYKVDEFYENNSEDTYEANKKLAIDRVKAIFQRTSDGDILLFSTTIAEIHKLVEELNKSIPNNCIALPYYGKLDEQYKSISKEGKEEIEKITFHRDDIVKIFTKQIKEKDAKKVNTKTYKRGCIIATNAAEASLTIKSLKFVVDIGFENTVSYNYDIDNDEQKIEKITEASRIQRKGRVGRRSSGTVYHMYPKGSRELILPQYKITKEEFSQKFIDLLSDSNKEVIETNLIKKLTTFNDNLDENQIIKINKPFTTEFIIGNQYSIDKFYKDNINLSNSNLKQEMYQYLFPSYMDGFSYNQLLDLSGFFYIINPFEKVRNINSGNFINDSGNVEILSEEYIDKFYKRALITNDLVLYKNQVYKTEYNKIKKNINLNIFNYNERFKRGFITLNLLNNDLDILFIFIYNIIESKNSKINAKTLYEYSELAYYYDIFSKLNDRIDFKKFSDNIKKETQQISKKINNQNINNIKDILKFCKDNKYDSQKYNSIIKSLLDGSFSENNLLENISEDNNNFIKEELLKSNNIKDFANYEKLEYDDIINILEKSIKYKNKVNNFFDDNKSKLDQLKKIFKFKNYKDELKIILFSFLSSYIDFVYFTENEITRNIYNNIKLNLKKSYNLEFINNLGFYLKNKNFIEILSNIRKEELIMINPLIFSNVKNNPIIETKNDIDYTLFLKNDKIMKGGFIFHPIIKYSFKLSIDTLKKIDSEYKNYENIDTYDFSYVIKDNSNNLGLYLIKRENFNILKIKIIQGTDFINNFISNKFLSKGFIVITINS